MLGAALVFFPQCASLTSQTFLAWCLSIAAGVMIYVSMIEIFNKSVDSFHDAGESQNDAYLYGTISFFGGILLNALLGKLTELLDDDDHDHELPTPRAPDDEKSPKNDGLVIVTGAEEVKIEQLDEAPPTSQAAADEPHAQKKLMKMGLKTAVAIGLHNFPEGLATFVATLDDPAVGGALAIAIAIHNIPEGICVAMPVFYATGSRGKAFFWAFVSGVSEPIGAGLGWLVLYNTVNDRVYGVVFGVVGGMMVHISIKELIPTALKYDKAHAITHNGICAGFLIMSLSLVLFKYT
eukprot:TRINITY_DN26754_c0_g1_i1.p1 TRINITY_DN26754_c0_g1~~TRINITY_DN26754_c0_g1_i1.p1  ORF type:complete len:294 (+),score=58.63 TRINITY_DN26754_c0_g1_i1:204-1085(+)